MLEKAVCCTKIEITPSLQFMTLLFFSPDLLGDPFFKASLTADTGSRVSGIGVGYICCVGVLLAAWVSCQRCGCLVCGTFFVKSFYEGVAFTNFQKPIGEAMDSGPAIHLSGHAECLAKIDEVPLVLFWTHVTGRGGR